MAFYKKFHIGMLFGTEVYRKLSLKSWCQQCNTHCQTEPLTPQEIESETDGNKFSVAYSLTSMHTYVYLHLIYNSTKSHKVYTLEDINTSWYIFSQRPSIGNMRSNSRKNFRSADKTVTQPQLHYPPGPMSCLLNLLITSPDKSVQWRVFKRKWYAVIRCVGLSFLQNINWIPARFPVY